jgi:hypothetical protein
MLESAWQASQEQTRSNKHGTPLPRTPSPGTATASGPLATLPLARSYAAWTLCRASRMLARSCARGWVWLLEGGRKEGEGRAGRGKGRAGGRCGGAGEGGWLVVGGGRAGGAELTARVSQGAGRAGTGKRLVTKPQLLLDAWLGNRPRAEPRVYGSTLARRCVSTTRRTPTPSLRWQWPTRPAARACCSAPAATAPSRPGSDVMVCQVVSSCVSLCQCGLCRDGWRCPGRRGRAGALV